MLLLEAYGHLDEIRVVGPAQHNRLETVSDHVLWVLERLSELGGNDVTPRSRIAIESLIGRGFVRRCRRY